MKCFACSDIKGAVIKACIFNAAFIFVERKMIRPMRIDHDVCPVIIMNGLFRRNPCADYIYMRLFEYFFRQVFSPFLSDDPNGVREICRFFHKLNPIRVRIADDKQL